MYTVDEFKAQFPRFSPQFLSGLFYKNGLTYFKGNIVYYGNSFYICIVENTTSDPLTTSDWKLYNDSVLNYTQDEDIQEAIQEASINFNKNLFGDCTKAKTAFGLLVAHFLTVDFNNALGLNGVGIPTSKSVGSVSEGYSIPAWLNNNEMLSTFATTGYGIKYASLIRPLLTGNILLFKGGPTIA
jgi:hypothetical protein